METSGCEIHARAPAGAEVLMFMQTPYKRERERNGTSERDTKGRGESKQSSRMCVCINVFVCVCASGGMGGIPPSLLCGREDFRRGGACCHDHQSSEEGMPHVLQQYPHSICIMCGYVAGVGTVGSFHDCVKPLFVCIFLLCVLQATETMG